MAVKWPGVVYKKVSSYANVMHGSDVKRIQTRLQELKYFTVTVGGHYWTHTENAVTKFQKAYKAATGTNIGSSSGNPDGIVGKKTWEALFSGQAESILPEDVTKPAPTVTKPKKPPALPEFNSNIITEAAKADLPFKSYIINLATDTWVPLPVLPESVTESVSASWSPTSIPGRSASYYTYAGTNNRTLSFSFTLHRDLLSELSTGSYDFNNIPNYLKSLCYPEYSSSLVRPPVCILKLADVIKMRGICTSVTVTHQLPLRNLVNSRITSANFSEDKKIQYNYLNVSLQFTEVPIRAPKASDITKNTDLSYKK